MRQRNSFGSNTSRSQNTGSSRFNGPRRNSMQGGYGRGGGFNRGPRHQGRRKPYVWSEIDLIRAIEYANSAPEVLPQDAYQAVNTFQTFGLENQLVENILRKGYSVPSPIQDQAIPNIINGKDIIGIANTGTGKTAAFLIPLINKVAKDRREKVLIVTPTRELAEQINSEFLAFTSGLRMYSTLIIGGKNMRAQVSRLRMNPNFVIGTPGRIKDLVQRRALNLNEFANVVLDETDRMVDIGFLSEIKFFIALLPKVRQSLFFSATVSKKVDEILHSFVSDPVTISVKKTDTLSNIRQDLIRVPQSKTKFDLLHEILSTQEFEKVIVFGNTKWKVQQIADELNTKGHNAEAIHGDKRQNQRQATLQKFKNNEIRVLLATDVAARGLDISNVSHVINFELPNTYEDYIHRIGRTGRADKSGVALTFVSN